MKRKPSSVPPDALDDLLTSALATQAAPDAALVAKVRRDMRRATPRSNRVLPWLAALGGSALTWALVFALTVLFPDPPWKQLLQALGYTLCAGTWLMSALSVLLLPRYQERTSL